MYLKTRICGNRRCLCRNFAAWVFLQKMKVEFCRAPRVLVWYFYLFHEVIQFPWQVRVISIEDFELQSSVPSCGSGNRLRGMSRVLGSAMMN